MVTIGEGATAQVQADIQKLGTNLLQVFRGQGFGGGGGARSPSPPFTMDDVEAIENEISGVRAVAPTLEHAARRRSTATPTGRRRSPAPATSTSRCATGRWRSGRNFSECELRAGAAVCMLGNTVKQELFGEQDPLGL